MGNLKGKFQVIKKNGKYRIYYLEKSTLILCSKKSFDAEIDAMSYIINHKAELVEYVSNLLEKQQSKEDAKIEKETAKTVKKVKKEEEKEKRHEEKETKKAEKKAEKAKKKEAKKAEREKNKELRKIKRNRFIAGVVATATFLVGGHFLAVGISNLCDRDEENKDKKPTSTQGPTEPTKEQPNPEISNGIDNIINKDETLNQENFEKLVAGFAKEYSDKNLNVTTEDVIKFVSIVNIDSLVEENPEFAKELFGTQTKEEYLQDAAKVIGMTYSYNRQVFEKEGSTENFIRISDSVYGEQKEILKIIESYVDQIALVRYDSEKVNELISELIVRLSDPQSNLSYLDNGVGFGMQVNIELIRSYLAKDVISKENYDMLTLLTSAEEYTSNIFTLYDGCMNSYTKTR